MNNMKGVTTGKRKPLSRCVWTNMLAVTIGIGIICTLSGLLIILGLTGMLSNRAAEALHIPTVTTFHVMLIVLGVGMLVHSITGIYGITFEKPRVLIVYILIIYALLVGQMTCAIGGAVSYKKLPAVASAAWDDASLTSLCYIEETFHCCGFYNTTDRVATPECGNTIGCKSAIFTASALYKLGGCFIALVAVEIFAAVIFSMVAYAYHKHDILTENKYKTLASDDPETVAEKLS